MSKLLLPVVLLTIFVSACASPSVPTTPRLPPEAPSPPQLPALNRLPPEQLEPSFVTRLQKLLDSSLTKPSGQTLSE